MRMMEATSTISPCVVIFASLPESSSLEAPDRTASSPFTYPRRLRPDPAGRRTDQKSAGGVVGMHRVDLPSIVGAVCKVHRNLQELALFVTPAQVRSRQASMLVVRVCDFVKAGRHRTRREIPWQHKQAGTGLRTGRSAGTNLRHRDHLRREAEPGKAGPQRWHTSRGTTHQPDRGRHNSAPQSPANPGLTWRAATGGQGSQHLLGNVGVGGRFADRGERPRPASTAQSAHQRSWASGGTHPAAHRGAGTLDVGVSISVPNTR